MSKPSSAIRNYLHCWHECFGEENISSFTNEQTDIVSKIAKDDIYCWSLPDVISQLRTIYSLKLALSYVDKMLKLAHSNETITREFNYAYPRQVFTQQYNALHVYTDYLRMVKAMNAGQTLRPDFSSIQEIGEKHDALVPIFNALKEENNKRAFEERLAKWKKFEYEAKDGKYAIVAPKEPGDLAREGFELHHCVKSYIGSVTEGKTNIVFIRETSDLDKPFFTVEISNENVIQQIHGLGNCNMDVVDGLEKFVKEWTKK